MKFLNILRHKLIEHRFMKSFQIKFVIRRELDLHYFDDTKSRSKSRQILMTQSSFFFRHNHSNHVHAKNVNFNVFVVNSFFLRFSFEILISFFFVAITKCDHRSIIVRIFFFEKFKFSEFFFSNSFFNIIFISYFDINANLKNSINNDFSNIFFTHLSPVVRFNEINIVNFNRLSFETQL